MLGFVACPDSIWGVTWGCKTIKDAVGGLRRLQGAMLSDMLDGVNSTQAFPHKSIR